jgi:hypothetical protein
MRALSKNCLLLALSMELYACSGAGNRAGPAGPSQHHVDLQWSPGSNADVTYKRFRSLTSLSLDRTSLTGQTHSD